MADFELDDFDFGFTTASQKDIIAPFDEELTHLRIESQNKAEQMYKLIMPLLNNLSKDADTNEYIHWPNRKEKIEAFKKKLESIIK